MTPIISCPKLSWNNLVLLAVNRVFLMFQLSLGFLHRDQHFLLDWLSDLGCPSFVFVLKSYILHCTSFKCFCVSSASAFTRASALFEIGDSCSASASTTIRGDELQQRLPALQYISPSHVDSEISAESSRPFRFCYPCRHRGGKATWHVRRQHGKSCMIDCETSACPSNLAI